MIVLINSQGSLVATQDEDLFQGSSNLNNINLIAPFGSNVIFKAMFELPNGVIMPENLDGYIFKPSININSELNAWRLPITFPLTQYKGIVKIQIRGIVGNQVVCSTTIKKVIQEGIPYSSDFTELSDKDQLLEMISDIFAKLNNKVDSVKQNYSIDRTVNNTTSGTYYVLENQYTIDSDVDEKTTGIYYVLSSGNYIPKVLPTEYMQDTTYYRYLSTGYVAKVLPTEYVDGKTYYKSTTTGYISQTIAGPELKFLGTQDNNSYDTEVSVFADEARLYSNSAINGNYSNTITSKVSANKNNATIGAYSNTTSDKKEIIITPTSAMLNDEEIATDSDIQNLQGNIDNLSDIVNAFDDRIMQSEINSNTALSTANSIANSKVDQESIEQVGAAGYIKGNITNTTEEVNISSETVFSNTKSQSSIQVSSGKIVLKSSNSYGMPVETNETVIEILPNGAKLNNENIVTNTVDNLTNYYTKAQTYTQTEVNNLVNQYLKGSFVAVQTLPIASEETVGKIYLVPNTEQKSGNIKDEYITIKSEVEDGSYTYSWEKIGTTEIDLSDYVDKSSNQTISGHKDFTGSITKNGEELATETLINSKITQTISSTSTSEEIPSAKAVYDYINSAITTVLNTEV